MKKKMNNKGFSLVELIIVIAIMAVLVGVLAPTYLGYVEKSKKRTDLQNAQTLATSLSVHHAELDSTTAVTGGSIPTGITVPSAQSVSTATWTYDFDGEVVTVYLNGVELFPDPDATYTN